MNYGFIYCLASEAMPGIYKIGMTERAPSQRCFELSSSTSAPLAFKILCYGEVDNALSVEREIHGHFSSQRINASREFFRVDYRNIVEMFDQYADPVAHTSDGVEESERARLMSAFFCANSTEQKAMALLAALKFSGARIWRDGDSIKTSKKLAFDSWMTGAAAGLKETILELIPRQEPVTRLMTLVSPAKATEGLDW
ncbi:GIY-YIG nuclease family protein [Pseudomonas agarici]|uniref:GIY-YIG nuclease family protein n=1 Tax=Pseudomonas agarici TaxID=46677 RepID=UPI0003071E7D|nr:GIY-YIG nuclease family protein [Pseudomonas agarici]NWC11973.1 GIY-YIG nuclease family protein [Pseudomonas agarici]SEL91514.1 T5orf172 domain-containing protein [Pseudomonas agarici]